MTFTATTRRFLSIMLTALFLLTTVTSVHAQASMIGTSDVINQEQASVDRDALKSMLSDQAVQEKIASMGVSADQVEQRINSQRPARRSASRRRWYSWSDRAVPGDLHHYRPALRYQRLQVRQLHQSLILCPDSRT
jgi:transposase